MGTRLILVGLLTICGLSFSQECRGALLENVDFPGTDITSLRSPDAEHCQQLCTQHPSCLFFTFIRREWTTDNRNFYCYLKSTETGNPMVQKPLLGVTSGYSLKECDSGPKPCLSQMYQNTDFLGSDYKAVFTTDHEECQRVCTQDPSCQFFTFVNDDFTPERIRNKCHLKFSWTIPRTPVVKKEAGVVSGFSHKMEITQYFEPVCQGKLFSNTDIPGSDMEILPAASAEHCQALCSAHPQCTYFSYVSSHFNCHLKKNPNYIVTTAKEGITSGLPVHFCQLANDWLKVAHVGVSFPGSDIRFELMDDAETCQMACTLDRNCQFYSYFTDSYAVNDSRRRCYFKRVITLPAPPNVNKLANVVSGLRSCAQTST